MQRFLRLLGTLWLVCNVPVQLWSVELQQRGDGFTVSIEGQPLARFDIGKHGSRPFFHDVRATDGTILSRPVLTAGEDDPHHTGLWVAVDKVNGIEFWHEQGRIKNVSVDLVETGTNPAIVRVRNQWLSPSGVVVLDEESTIRIFENRVLAYDIRFTAGAQGVTFGDTEEGFFAFRMADSMSEEVSGRVENADGLTTTKHCWGKTSQWVDYYGQIGDQVYGVAIFDHPSNFRRGRYHVRDYGLFTINPFGEGDYTQGQQPPAPLKILPGNSLRLRYGLYLHDGDTRQGRVAQVFQEWAALSTDAATNAASLQEIGYRSAADGTLQKAMFFAPAADDAVPLLVALHTWSGDYRQNYHGKCAAWCRQHNWAYIHPNFRGPNRRREATGSDLVVQDIVDAVTFAAQHAEIDLRRVYLVGTSGGGYTALLMAGRRPELWAGVSAWVPIVDLARWYHENKAKGGRHWREIAASCGGPPGTSEQVDQQYRLRSPLTWLPRARGVNIDINAGIRDGHEGDVPVSHALRAFNAIAAPTDRLSGAEIDYFVQEARVPNHLRQEIDDASYGSKQPLFRRSAQRVRITLFEGGHELIASAALAWLQQQRRLPPTAPHERSSH